MKPYYTVYISLTGIEFWSNVCDEEVDLEIERSEAEELGKPPENVSRFYAKVILSLTLGCFLFRYFLPQSRLIILFNISS